MSGLATVVKEAGCVMNLLPAVCESTSSTCAINILLDLIQPSGVVLLGLLLLFKIFFVFVCCYMLPPPPSFTPSFSLWFFESRN